MIYFDNSATTYPKPQVVYDALDFANKNLAFNAGRGNYDQARKCSDIIKVTREKIASLINDDYNNVVFMSSATEALNIIINGIDFSEGDNIYYSPFEHNSIIRPLYYLKENKKVNLNIIPFDETTLELDLQKLQNEFAKKPPKAVFVSHISNVIGNILPYEIIFEMSKAYASINVLDCAQSFGILNPKKGKIDFIVFAGHKSLYASFGIAGFINLNNYKLRIVKSGGNGSDSLNHEMPMNHFGRYESGTPNVVAIYGLNASLDWLKNNNICEHEKKLLYYFIEKVKNNSKVKLYIPKNSELIGIVSFNVQGYKSFEVGEILNDEFNICVRTGYHCAVHIHDLIKSHEYGGTVRISVGAFNTYQEIDCLISAIETL